MPRFPLDTCPSKGIISFNIYKTKKDIFKGRNIIYAVYQLFSVTGERGSSFTYSAKIHLLAKRCRSLNNLFVFSTLLIKMKQCLSSRHQLVLSDGLNRLLSRTYFHISAESIQINTELILFQKTTISVN